MYTIDWLMKTVANLFFPIIFHLLLTPSITDLFSTCMAEKLRNYGNPICTEKIINQFQQFYGSTMGNVMNFACENFEDQQDRCEKMIDKQEKLTGSIKPANWRTPFPILIEFFQTL